MKMKTAIEQNLSNIIELCLSVPFLSAESAALACQVMSVDKELKGSGVHRQITTDGANLKISFQGSELKKLRVALNSCLKNINLIVKTINQFENS